MAHPIALLGDTSSHGGSITTSAAHTMVEGKLVARVSDVLNCPIHGPNVITTGSPNFNVEGQKCARSTSMTACGATIIGSATKTVCE